MAYVEDRYLETIVARDKSMAFLMKVANRLVISMVVNGCMSRYVDVQVPYRDFAVCVQGREE